MNRREGSVHEKRDRRAQFRFYEELNDFLPPERRKRSFAYRFTGTPSVKDAIEAIGVPHVEVDMIMVDGTSAGFDHLLHGGEGVAVYPVFERFDVTDVQRLRPEPLRQPRFILDVHLGKLARRMRLLGFDALFENDFEDSRIAQISRVERRTILTRDRGLLMRNTVTRGHWVRANDAADQVREVVDAFDLTREISPFTRCTKCNGKLVAVTAEAVATEVPDRVLAERREFHRCRDCDQVYWKGSHFTRIQQWIDELVGARRETTPG